MTGLYLVPVFLSLLILAAHFLREGNTLVMMILLLMPLLLLIRRSWSARTIQFALVLGSFEWLRTLLVLTARRHADGAPWVRMAIILGAVTLITLASAAIFAIPRLRRRYSGERMHDPAQRHAISAGNLDNNPAAAKFARP